MCVVVKPLNATDTICAYSIDFMAVKKTLGTFVGALSNFLEISFNLY